MKQVGRGEYLFRHLRQLMPYVTVTKLLNLALNVLELRLNISCPRSLPPYIKVEPTPLCQLACPGCAHGTSDLKKQLTNRMHFSLDDLKDVIDSLGSCLFGVSLSLRGEPLLGKDLLPMLEYIHARRIAVSFPTNLSLHLRAEQIERLVRSGVDTVYVSLDGASESTYCQYRVGGDFNLVLRNVKAISEAKKRIGTKCPRLVWKFVVFRHNEHELPAVTRTHRDLGFDDYELVSDHDSQATRHALSKHNEHLVENKKPCYWAWHTTVIRADGEVLPCCKQQGAFGLGNVKQGDIRSIWRGSAYVRLRRGFKTMRAAEMNAVCARCVGAVDSDSSTAAVAHVGR